jgi:hypothetical protein
MRKQGTTDAKRAAANDKPENGKTEKAKKVCSTGVVKFKNGLATGYGQPQDRAKPLRMLVARDGVEQLNRRRQPFQG